ncbi:MAG: 4a-hydroxytetrahydrobiopterin dehydratase [Gracilimonas sp.]|uniref:4a-hydroxytetrahydrobiopterin dehydratase n=1 Tax=Gracilimonas sp. TaxID=1974203 RepID=UPI0019BB3993|nr:4a-hydroxytetrahydrobiopterin dehydratase [Gracilimonas sp.]MBD3617437.1 4a-hydroxytetrahydrobiopterin dehydratase [Gracilimonas sp.]
MNKEQGLTERKCEACHPDTPVLKGRELREYYQQLGGDWKLVDDHHLTKTYEFNNFREALDFTVKIGEMSEDEGHHPEIKLTWGKVTVTVYTHAIDGLSENDFIWAAKADQIDQ